MDSIGKQITLALQSKGISVKKLAKSLNLSVLTIQNIIYGKSRKFMYLREIESFLNISLVQINPDFSLNTNHSLCISVDRLDHIFALIRDVILSMKTSLPKKQLDILSSLTYDLNKSNPSLSDNEICMFIKGMIKLGFASKFFDLNLGKSIINCEDSNEKIDVDLLYSCLRHINAALKFINAEITKQNIDTLSGILYDLHSSNKNLSDKEIHMFLLGILKLGKLINLVK